MLVLVTRPDGRAEATAQAIIALGHQVIVDPALAIELLDRPPVDLAGIQGILVTSAHAVPALPPAGRALPLFCVGPATAAAARRQGWPEPHQGPGDGVGLAALVGSLLPPGSRLLHLAGADIRPGLHAALAAAGLDCRTLTVYRAVASGDLGAATRAALAEGRLDAATFFSPRSAGHWADLVRRAGLAATLDRVTAVCLSRAIADMLTDLPWRGVVIALRRDQSALLDCLEALRP